MPVILFTPPFYDYLHKIPSDNTIAIRFNSPGEVFHWIPADFGQTALATSLYIEWEANDVINGRVESCVLREQQSGVVGGSHHVIHSFYHTLPPSCTISVVWRSKWLALVGDLARILGTCGVPIEPFISPPRYLKYDKCQYVWGQSMSLGFHVTESAHWPHGDLGHQIRHVGGPRASGDFFVIDHIR